MNDSMTANGIRAAIYLRVSRDDQTTANQRLVLERAAQHRGWTIVQTYEDAGISGGRGRDQRPGFDAMLRDAVRRRFDTLMVWSIDLSEEAFFTWRTPWRNSMRPGFASIAINRAPT